MDGRPFDSGQGGHGRRTGQAHRRSLLRRRPYISGVGFDCSAFRHGVIAHGWASLFEAGRVALEAAGGRHLITPPSGWCTGQACRHPLEAGWPFTGWASTAPPSAVAPARAPGRRRGAGGTTTGEDGHPIRGAQRVLCSQPSAMEGLGMWRAHPVRSGTPVTRLSVRLAHLPPWCVRLPAGDITLSR